MLTRRLIACLDLQEARVVKGTRFVDLRDVGDPVVLATRYEGEGADEIVLLDIAATPEGRSTMLDLIRRTAERLFIPLTVGGGVRSVEGIQALLHAGADKVCINSAAVHRPALIGEGAWRFGTQCIVASIDAIRVRDRWEVVIAGGREPTGLDAVAWARECVARGAGEILLTSIDRDGARGGYDLELTRAVVDAAPVPVVASGGAGSAQHVVDVLGAGGADAALVAGILHDGTASIRAIKAALVGAALPVRAEAA